MSASELSQRSALLQQSCTEGLRSRATIACDEGNGVCASEGLRSRDEDNGVSGTEALRSCDAIACDVDNGAFGLEALRSRDADN